MTLTLDLHFFKLWSIANVLLFNLIPCMTCFRVFFNMTYFFNLDLLWPWPVTYIGIVHLGHGAKFVCMVNMHHPTKFHAFITIWNILATPKLTINNTCLKQVPNIFFLWISPKLYVLRNMAKVIDFPSFFDVNVALGILMTMRANKVLYSRHIRTFSPKKHFKMLYSCIIVGYEKNV